MPPNKNKDLTANDLLGKFACDKAVTYYTRKNLLYYSKEKTSRKMCKGQVQTIVKKK